MNSTYYFSKSKLWLFFHLIGDIIYIFEKQKCFPFYDERFYVYVFVRILFFYDKKTVQNKQTPNDDCVHVCKRN